MKTKPDTMTHHQQAKAQLKAIAAECRALYKNDKPAQRQTINDAADQLAREYWRHYSEKQSAIYTDYLHRYAASLHP